MENVFSHAFRNNVWGDPESVSGPGSGLHRTVVFRNEIPKLMAELGAHSLLDAGCGDFNWMKEVALEGHYIGVDIVADLIKQNRRYADSRRTFVHADITRDFLPQVDVILCRDCLVHFSFADVWVTLCNFTKSQSRYLLTTTFVDHADNVDIVTGEWRPLNLERTPFGFPRPCRTIDEKCLHSDGIYADKRLALWPLYPSNEGASIKTCLTDFAPCLSENL